MGKTIKLKDDTYLDSSGVMYNRNKLNGILYNLLKCNLQYTTDGNEAISDNQTKIYQLERGGFYLFIDSHPYNNSIGIINGFDGSVKYIIQPNVGHLIFTYNTSNYKMTIQTINGARFKLYKIEAQPNI